MTARKLSAQLVFDLTAPPALGRADFFVSGANALAVRMLAEPGRWPAGKLLLTGPEGSGKTHLAGIWAAERGAAVFSAGDLPESPPRGRPGAVVVEDAGLVAGDARAEAALFHLHNHVLASGGYLLLTASAPPGVWGLATPDLLSRMDATARAALLPPDDALLRAVLVKLFADRQVSVAPNVIAYLVARIDRSFAAARDIVARLDARALARGSKVTRTLAAEVMGQPPDPLDRGGAEGS
ncbi:MAG: chromosomal replication initiator DnaA [Paracoccaceae bacterium]